MSRAKPTKPDPAPTPKLVSLDPATFSDPSNQYLDYAPPPSSEGKGMSIRTTIRDHTLRHSILQRIAADPQFPEHTVADIYRSGADMRIKSCGRLLNDEKFTGYLAILDGLRRDAVMAESLENIHITLGKLSAKLAGYLAVGMYGTAASEFEVMRDRLRIVVSSLAPEWAAIVEDWIDRTAIKVAARDWGV